MDTVTPTTVLVAGTPASPTRDPERVVRLDARALRDLQRRIVRSVVARGPTSAVADHDDVAQTTWLRLLERPDMFGGRSSFSTFVVGVALNVRREVGMREQRRQRIQATLAYELTPQLAESLAAPEHDAPLEAALRRALARLDPPARWLVEERLVHARSYDELLPELRRRFAVPITTVEGLRTLLFRARRQLCAALAALRG
jgi:RNA polymerase sigma factor (sigma-70 family)